MARTTAESLLISALLNNEDPNGARGYGVRPEYFAGYRDEYEWVLNYYKKYNVCPTPEKLKIAFPGFPHDENEIDLRWPAQEVAEAAAGREILKGVMLASEAMRSGDVKKAYSVIEPLHYKAVSEKPVNLLEDPAYFEDYEDTSEIRVPMPWDSLQSATHGIGPGELWYFAARPQQGKSSFLTNIAVSAACAGQRVLFYSLEMTKRQVQVRSHAIMGHRLGWGNEIDSEAMLHRTWDAKKYRKLVAEIKESVPGEINVHDMAMGSVSPSTIIPRASEYDLIIIDYVGLMRLDGGARSVEDWRHAAVISNELKEIVLANKSRVLAAAQINRDGDQFGWRPPKLKHISQSDALGQDGDVVLTMKRYGRGASVTSIEKNRHGRSGDVFFSNYDANLGDFDEITRSRADEIADNDDTEEDE